MSLPGLQIRQQQKGFGNPFLTTITGNARALERLRRGGQGKDKVPMCAILQWKRVGRWADWNWGGGCVLRMCFVSAKIS